MTLKTAADTLGKLDKNCEIFGLCKGQFSLIDIIEHCLKTSGPADVVISTWTAAGADLKFAYKFMTNGTIRSCRFLVDFSFPNRQPEYCAALRETFGNDCVRITKNHAKFVLIMNDEWNFVIRSSMNLNENRRLESFEVSDDKNLADYLLQIIDEIFDLQDPEGQFDRKPMEHMKEFERLKESGGDQAGGEIMQSTDVKRFYNDGPYDKDLRRAGLSYLGKE